MSDSGKHLVNYIFSTPSSIPNFTPKTMFMMTKEEVVEIMD